MSHAGKPIIRNKSAYVSRNRKSYINVNNATYHILQKALQIRGKGQNCQKEINPQKR